jgi:hypothetical protein
MGFIRDGLENTLLFSTQLLISSKDALPNSSLSP